MKYDLKSIINAAKSKGYPIHTKPYYLNLIGVRTANASSPSTFDDYIAFFYYDSNGNLIGKVAPATVDPSVHYLKQVINKNGAAILKSGYYEDAYQIGLHRGKYKALVQRAPMTVIRDNDRNGLINFFADTETGLFGINMHKPAGNKSHENLIGSDSAGCQVFKNESDFNEMMNMAEKHTSFYPFIDYILLDEKDIVQKRNKILFAVGVILIASTISYLIAKKL